jgi:gamma-glutamyltranspeptidase
MFVPRGCARADRSGRRARIWASAEKITWRSPGSAGNIPFTVPQMISNVLDYNYDPYSAAVLPRMNPMRDDFLIEIETRIPERVARDLARIGAGTDPRRGGKAGGI